MTSIFLVNLMIAKMTSTYERIRAESLYYIATHRCHFIYEFKDERMAPSPLNLLSLVYFPFALLSRRLAGAERPPRKFEVEMGRKATRRLQKRDQQYARAHDAASRRAKTAEPEVRMATLHDTVLPALAELSQRCEAIETALKPLRQRHLAGDEDGGRWL